MRVTDRRPAFSWKSLRSEAGAIDVASAAVGVLIIAIIGSIIAASVFLVIPWSQDKAAKQNLDAVSVAEGVSMTQHSRYFSHADLRSKGLLSANGAFDTQTNAAGDCWFSLARSSSGKLFYETNELGDAAAFDPATNTGAGCITAAQVTAMVTSLTPSPTASPTSPATSAPTASPSPSPTPTPTELNPGEPTTPPANVTGAGVVIRQATYPGYSDFYPSRSIPEMSVAPHRFSFSITGATDAARFDVAWSSASMNSINAKAPSTSSLMWWNGSPSWYADVTVGPGGYKVGTGYLVATVTDKTTGERSVYSWTITVTPVTVTSSNDANYGSAGYHWADKTVPETSTSPAIFAWSIQGANPADWDIAVTGAQGLNSTSQILTASQYQYWQGRTNWRVEIRPPAQGFALGSTDITMTAKHVPTGKVLTKTWKLTIGALTVTQSTDDNYISSTYWLDQTVPETSGGTVFAWSIKNANPADWDISVTGAQGLNSTSEVLTASQYQYWAGFTNWRVAIRPPAQGFEQGTTRIVMTAVHRPSGKVITKEWQLTVGPLTVTQSTDDNYRQSTYWLDKSVPAGSVGTIFAWSLKAANRPDWTIEVTGAEAVNATAIIHTNSQYAFWAGHTNWRTEIKANTGGLTSGVANITMKATHNPSGKVLTKTWKLTVP